MKITQEGNEIRFQLVDMVAGLKLFDFKIPKDAFTVLKEHMIEKLNEFEVVQE